MTRTWTVVFSTLGGLLIVVSYAGWFAFNPLLPGAQMRLPDAIELPLSSPNAIAVDSRGRVYLGLDFYSRIQVYSAAGTFVRGWFIRARGGTFRLDTDDQDRLHVATARGDMHYVYTAEGELVESERRNLFHEFPEQQCQDDAGRTYDIRSAMWWPQVVRTDASGHEAVVVAASLPLWFLAGPFPVWLLGVLGVLVLVASNRWFRALTVKLWRLSVRMSFPE